MAAPVLKIPKTDTRFEALARLNPYTATDVAELCEDCGFDAESFMDAIAGILVMDIGLVFTEDTSGYLQSIAIHRDNWRRARVMASAYLERTYGA